MIVMLSDNSTSEPATDTDAVFADSKGTIFLCCAAEPINIASDLAEFSSMPCCSYQLDTLVTHHSRMALELVAAHGAQDT